MSQSLGLVASLNLEVFQATYRNHDVLESVLNLIAPNAPEAFLTEKIENRQLKGLEVTALYTYLLERSYYKALGAYLEVNPELSIMNEPFNQLGDTIVHRLIESNQAELFNVIILATAFKFDHRDVAGDTYLHRAVQFGRVEMVRTLVQKFPALRGMTNNAGRSARDQARRFNKPRILEILN